MSLVCLKPFTGLNFFMIWTLHTSLALPVSLRPTACFSNPDLMVPHSIPAPANPANPATISRATALFLTSGLCPGFVLCLQW